MEIVLQKLEMEIEGFTLINIYCVFIDIKKKLSLEKYFGRKIFLFPSVRKSSRDEGLHLSICKKMSSYLPF